MVKKRVIKTGEYLVDFHKFISFNGSVKFPPITANSLHYLKPPKDGGRVALYLQEGDVLTVDNLYEFKEIK